MRGVEFFNPVPKRELCVNCDHKILKMGAFMSPKPRVQTMPILRFMFHDNELMCQYECLRLSVPCHALCDSEYVAFNRWSLNQNSIFLQIQIFSPKKHMLQPVSSQIQIFSPKKQMLWTIYIHQSRHLPFNLDRDKQPPPLYKFLFFNMQADVLSGNMGQMYERYV